MLSSAQLRQLSPIAPPTPAAAAPDVAPPVAAAGARPIEQRSRGVTLLQAAVACGTLALLGLCGALVAARLLLGWYPLVVYTGSMAPTIPVGAVVVVRPVAIDRLAVGDVISFHAPQTGPLPVTHRIVAMEPLADGDGNRGWQLVTQGDANRNPDVWRVGARQLGGRVELTIPAIGYILVALARPDLRNAILAVIAVLLVARVAHRVTQAGVASAAGAAIEPVAAGAQR